MFEPIKPGIHSPAWDDQYQKIFVVHQSEYVSIEEYVDNAIPLDTPFDEIVNRIKNGEIVFANIKYGSTNYVEGGDDIYYVCGTFSYETNNYNDGERLTITGNNNLTWSQGYN